jgi:hypothetical protein
MIQKLEAGKEGRALNFLYNIKLLHMVMAGKKNRLAEGVTSEEIFHNGAYADLLV